MTHLPSTQPVPDSLDENSPVDYENPWGRFYPMNIQISSYINLTQSSFKVGRFIGCDYVLTLDAIGEKLYNSVSNVHFQVERKEEKDGLFVTQITDLSTNGTYINGNLIGKNNKSVLSNHDTIAIAKNTYSVFLYVDFSEASCQYPGEITKNYTILNVLGKGGYGEVTFVMKKQPIEKFAMKTINMTPIEEKDVIDAFSEVKILRKLKHENIVRLHNTVLAENNMYLFLEYVPGGDLAQLLMEKKRLSEDVTKFIFYQILKGVQFLHEKSVIHRDLKPANILLTNKKEYPRIKITDFGLSKILENRMAAVHTRCGTLSYAAPELQFPNVSKTYDFRADVWSLGVILFQCLSGTLPFNRARKDMTIEKQINKANFSMDGDIWTEITFRPKCMIRMCLVRRPEGRCVVQTMVNDEWFRTDPMFSCRVNKLNVNKENSHEPVIPAKRARIN